MDYQFVVKRILKRVASPVLDFCGVYDSLLSRRVFAQQNWLVLMYHRVTTSSADDPFRLGMCIDARHFEEQVRFHVSHFTPITVADAVARIRAGKPLPRNAISLTFDDGYLDFKSVALPILKRHACPATVYVTTGGLEERQIFWWDRITSAIASTRKRTVNIREIASGESITELSLSLMKRRRSLLQLLDILWRQPPEHLEETVDRLCEELVPGDTAPLPAARLSHDDIRELGREDVEIGAHCEQHFDMRRLSPDACRHELETSRQLLRELSGQAVTGFAYPGGRENAAVQGMVARSGFSYAAGTVRGLNQPPYDMFSLRRLGTPDTGIADYKRCLANAAGAPPLSLANESVPWP